MNSGVTDTAVHTAAGRRRRLLFLVPSLRGGGAERVMVSLLRHLDRERFELALAVVDMSNAVFAADLPSDVELIDLGCTRVRQAVPGIIRLIRHRRPDVVFSTLGYLNLAIAIVRPLLPRGTRFVARETAMVSRGIVEFRYPRVLRALYRRFYGSLDLIVCQSQAMLADVRATFGVPASKMVVINNPVDVERVRALAAQPVAWPASEGAARLVAVGRLGREKGFDLLLDALALLADVRLQLVILGEGALDAELRQQAQRLGIADRVHFAGYQTNPYAWIARADAFVLSSRHEGFPNVVIESLACGKPVIATPAPGGTLEILEHVPGSRVASAVSADALAQAIRDWLASRGQAVAPVDLAPYRLDTIVARYADAFTLGNRG
jgi:glycosyltransferase involved in cell wall biosynthesis